MNGYKQVAYTPLRVFCEGLFVSHGFSREESAVIGKVVDGLGNVDLEAVRADAAGWETMVW
jgi:hypothetical protein